MLDAAKNKVRVKISYVMIALTVAGCVLMIIEGKEGKRTSPIFYVFSTKDLEEIRG